MKHVGKIAICMAGGLVLQTNARALTSENSPYAAIVKQNVFRLKSPLPVAHVEPVVPPPRIILLGIVSAPGSKQVIFKTLTGPPPRETSYALGEMDLANEIEVVEIVESTGLVRVKNHGQEQMLSLEKDGMKPGGGNAATASAATARLSISTDSRGAGLNQPQKPTMTAEEQMIRMEVNRKLTAEQAEQGLMPPLPPTPMTAN